MTVALVTSSGANVNSGFGRATGGTCSPGLTISSPLPRDTFILLGFYYNSPDGSLNNLNKVTDSSGNSYKLAAKLQSIRTTSPGLGLYQAVDFRYAVAPLKAGLFTVTCAMDGYTDNLAMCMAAFSGVDSYHPFDPALQYSGIDFTNGVNRPPSTKVGTANNGSFLVSVMGSWQGSKENGLTYGGNAAAFHDWSYSFAGTGFCEAEMDGLGIATANNNITVAGSVNIQDEMLLTIGLKPGSGPGFKKHSKGTVIG